MKNINKKVFIVSNSFFNIYNFRLNLIEHLISKDFKVTLIASEDSYINPLSKLDVKIIKMNINLSKNIFSNIYLILLIYKVLVKHKPSIVIAYTLKPNLYFSLVSKFLKIK